jgi:cytochrome c biogenesis factor
VKDYYISVERYISASDSSSTKKNITDAKDALRWETLIVNVSVKPVMMLVWIGLLMSAAGFVWALFSGRRFR